ncbi:MAG: hypothetical protein ACHQ6T_03930 [Myxococcota bacterium]
MAQVAHTLAELESLEAAHPETLTLLDLVTAVADVAETEEEVVAAVHHLIDSGRVHLVGNFCQRDVRRTR